MTSKTTEKIEPEITCDTNEKSEPPKDKFHIIYILFFFLGLVRYLPFSFFNTATEFWMYKFRNVSSNETDSKFRTDLQAQFSATLLITLQISEVTFLTVGLLFGHLIRVRVRMIGVLSIIFCLFTLLTAFVKIDTDSWQGGFFGVVMAIAAGMDSMNGIFTITIYTILANLPRNYLAPYLAGSGLSRIFTSLLQILSLASGMSVENSALMYFCLGIVVIGFTLTAVILTGRNEFYLYQMRNFREGQKEKRVSFKNGLQLLKKIWPVVTMMALYTIALDACPTGLVVSEGEGNGSWNDLYFIPTITFLLGSTCDLIGRTIGFRYAPKMKAVYWVLFSALRTVLFVPLIMLSNAQPRDHWPVLLPHDYQYIIIVIVFNISGGYLVSRSSYNVAHLVLEEELKDAYHVNMVSLGVEMGVLSFISILSVKLL